MMKMCVWAVMWALFNVNMGAASNLAQDSDDSPSGRPIPAPQGPLREPKPDLHGFVRLVIDGTGAVYGVSPDRVATYLNRFPAELFLIPDEELQAALMAAFGDK